MSSLHRKNTVSRSSGPSHMNSYALRGIPIKYKTPIFVPDIHYLPATWKPPEMIPVNKIEYNFNEENKVISQARTRALSVAAEASLKRQQIEEIRQQQREREEAEERARKALEPQPPVNFTNDILTPVPVFNSTSLSGAPVTNSNQNSQDSESPTSTSEIELTVEPPVKALGQLSIREFEAQIDDPFEIASLQAINDMEVLQSVLQPIPPPIISTPPSTSPPVPMPTIQSSAPVLTQLPEVNTTPLRSTSSPTLTPRALKTQSQGISTTNPSTPFPSVTPPTMAPIQDHIVTPLQNMGAQASTSLTYPVADINVNNVPPVTGATSEPGVGLLIDLGGDSSPQPPSTAVRQPFMVQVERSQGSSHPVPKPRTQSQTPPTSPYPPNGQPSPKPLPRTNRHVRSPSPHRDTVDVAPAVPPKPQGRVGFTIPSTNPPISQPTGGRRGLGVPVLPPIPTSSTPKIPSNLPPPPYSSPLTSHRVLPPYSSPPKPAPRAVPKGYTLPDPMSGLTASQKSTVESLAGMGFPPPRVARALIRYKGDNSKILDFMFLVGKLEEQKFAGNSAETALIACEEDAAKAVEYLKKVEGFKEIGFPEKKIHDAYEKSGKDWDKALDLLTEDR